MYLLGKFVLYFWTFFEKYEYDVHDREIHI
jgi:hypothetical protein